MNTALTQPLTDWTEEHDTLRTALEVADPDAVMCCSDPDDIIPSVVDAHARGVACECGCPTVTAWSKKRGDELRVCRPMIYAVKQSSLVHLNSDEICIRCVLKRNSDGSIAGAIHMTAGIDDYIGIEFIEPGLRSRVALGWIELWVEEDVVIMHDLAHTALQHCPGCEPVKHLHCGGPRICSQAVQAQSRTADFVLASDA